MIYIENKKRKLERIQAQYPDADILDITSSSELSYAKLLSPFYPHSNIPIPFTPNAYAMSVEGIWQGLKVFETCDIDMSSFSNDTMKDLKRTARKYGKPLGHRKGIYGSELLDYFDARMQIYLPSYKWVLDNVPRVHALVERIAERAKDHDIIFLDYNTNDDYRDLSSPLSHAGLVKLYIEGNYPKPGDIVFPLSADEVEARKNAKKQSKKSNKKQTKKQTKNQTILSQPTLF